MPLPLQRTEHTDLWTAIMKSYSNKAICVVDTVFEHLEIIAWIIAEDTCVLYVEQDRQFRCLKWLKRSELLNDLNKYHTPASEPLWQVYDWQDKQ